jgi:two-component system chemotaxis sensor kinase CheA
MTQDDVDELAPEMVTECLEALDDVEAALLEVEAVATLGEVPDVQQVDRAFRGMHTLKGIAGFLEADVIVAVSHGAENVLDRLRTRQEVPHAGCLGALAESVDVLRELLGGWLEGERGPRPDDLIAALEDLVRESDEPESEPTAKEPEVARPAPTPEEPADVSEPADGSEPGDGSDPDVGSAPDAIDEPEHAALEPDPPAQPVANRPPVEGPAETRSRAQPVPGIRVPISKLDELVNLVGELILAENSLLHHVDGSEAIDQDVVEPLHRITRDLQDLVMSVRMVPIRSTFQRMRRIAMDIARKQGKRIQLVLEGGATEVDKTVIEAISDPLLHLVRNACDHGIGTPEERREEGKPETGVLRLHARHESGEVQILIEDDGQGLDTDRILAKARAAGLVPNKHRPPDAAIHMLVFAPGLSTREQVTSVSGRGVGMDVVQTGITGVGGSVQIDSVRGRGTRFLIRLPLTLAIVDGMLFRRGTHTLAIPLTGIREIVPASNLKSLRMPGGVEMIDVFGTTVRLLDLPRELGPCDGGLLVILQDDQRLVALRTDALIGQQQLVVKPMPPLLERQFGWSGCTILSSGAIGLLVDVKSIVERGYPRSDVGWEGLHAG